MLKQYYCQKQRPASVICFASLAENGLTSCFVAHSKNFSPKHIKVTICFFTFQKLFKIWTWKMEIYM